jgi:hypothetical protein
MSVRLSTIYSIYNDSFGHDDIINVKSFFDTWRSIHERTCVSWMKIPCSGHVDFPQICGKASDWTLLYLNNI